MQPILQCLLLIALVAHQLPALATDFWTVRPSHQIHETEIRFASDGIQLVGTLYSPSDAHNGPAIVVVQQAGTETRDNPLYQQIGRAFTAIGVSVFLYDRRGTGDSEGSGERPRYDTMAKDAVAAKRAIGNHEAVNRELIGYWGISQGGWLAMEAGAMSEPVFVISVSAPLTTPGEQMEVMAYNYVLSEGFGKDAANRALEVRRIVMDDYFRGEVDHATAHKSLASIEDKPWFEWTWMIPADDLPRDITQTSWIHEMNYDPTGAYEGVDAPMLFLLGTEDRDIPVARTRKIAESLQPVAPRDVVVIPGADHVMRTMDAPWQQLQPGEHPQGEVSDSAKYFAIMANWVAAQLR